MFANQIEILRRKPDVSIMCSTEIPDHAAIRSSRICTPDSLFRPLRVRILRGEIGALDTGLELSEGGDVNPVGVDTTEEHTSHFRALCGLKYQALTQFRDSFQPQIDFDRAALRKPKCKNRVPTIFVTVATYAPWFSYDTSITIPGTFARPVIEQRLQLLLPLALRLYWLQRRTDRSFDRAKSVVSLPGSIRSVLSQ